MAERGVHFASVGLQALQRPLVEHELVHCAGLVDPVGPDGGGGGGVAGRGGGAVSRGGGLAPVLRLDGLCAGALHVDAGHAGGVGQVPHEGVLRQVSLLLLSLLQVLFGVASDQSLLPVHADGGKPVLHRLLLPGLQVAGQGAVGVPQCAQGLGLAGAMDTQWMEAAGSLPNPSQRQLAARAGGSAAGRGRGRAGAAARRRQEQDADGRGRSSDGGAVGKGLGLSQGGGGGGLEGGGAVVILGGVCGCKRVRRKVAAERSEVRHGRALADSAQAPRAMGKEGAGRHAAVGGGVEVLA